MMNTEKKVKTQSFQDATPFRIGRWKYIFLPYHKTSHSRGSRLFNFILTLLFCFDRRRRGRDARGPFSSRRDTKNEKRSKTKTMNCFIIIIIECTLASRKMLGASLKCLLKFQISDDVTTNCWHDRAVTLHRSFTLNNSAKKCFSLHSTLNLF